MRPITTKAEAEGAIAEIASLMEKLSTLLRREAELVHAGHVRSAAELAPDKTELTGQLLACGERLKANAKFIRQAAPDRCAALASVEQAFRAVVQRNMRVLSTAHAVSESIMRRLSTELSRKASPRVYGATGRAAAPGPRNARPLAVSRVL